MTDVAEHPPYVPPGLVQEAHPEVYVPPGLVQEAHPEVAEPPPYVPPGLVQEAHPEVYVPPGLVQEAHPEVAEPPPYVPPGLEQEAHPEVYVPPGLVQEAHLGPPPYVPPGLVQEAHLGPPPYVPPGLVQEAHPEVYVPPGLVQEAHPEVFDLRAMPEPTKEAKPGQLPQHMIRQFFEEGYVLVPEFFRLEELEPCRQAAERLVDKLAQKLYKAGKIQNLYKECGFFERLTQIDKEFPGANIILLKYPDLCDEFKKLWTNERLLNVVEQLIGPEINGHPLWNLRTKTPQNEATTVPWHQDCAYLDNECYTTLQATAWIPLLDTTANNGCMQMVKRGHRAGRVATHQCCDGGTWYVMLDEQEMVKSLGTNLATDIVTCEVPYGGMLLFNNIIPHRSLMNLSNDIRWSFDLRWQKPGLPNGFYGLKEGVLMRTAKDPNFKISWEKFDKTVRHKVLRSAAVEEEEDEFDTTVPGPWMKKWEIVHVNHHVDSFRADTAKTIEVQ